jgi:putative hydrolase of the HAD superfamily
MPPQFFYFDMGNVLLRFSHERMAEQMGRVAGIATERVWKLLFEDGLEWAFERGDFAHDAFFDRFCELTGTSPPRAELEHAANDIFEQNVPMVGLVGRLNAAGYPLGVLSNTSAAHWGHCVRRFGILSSMFSVHALSYELRAIKPDPAAFQRAAKLAGLPAERIFFTDDRAENIAAAKTVGYDAVLYESVTQLNSDLRSRGLVFNY